MAKSDPHELSYLQILALAVLRVGEVPQHIAIIMDGNRRYARKNGFIVQKGHEAGSNKLFGVDRWGKNIGCKELTLYAFSTENFKRCKEEVDALIELLYTKCNIMLAEVETGRNTDTCIQVIGNWDRFPLKLQYRMATLMQKTRHFKPYKVNVAVAYTGREGILRSLQTIPIQKKAGFLNPSQLNEHTIDQAQHVSDMRPVDMLIRTGGDNRLSDFMMWEASHAYIHFTPVTWPEFSFWDFMHSIFMFQFQRKVIPKLLLPISFSSEDTMVRSAITKSRTKSWHKINDFADKDSPVESLKTESYAPDPWRRAFTNALKF